MDAPRADVFAAGDPVVERAAVLFKALSSPARLAILHHLREPSSVSEVVHGTGLSQPLVSQHLRILRGASLVGVTRTGRDAVYCVSNTWATEIVDDTLAHFAELKGGR